MHHKKIANNKIFRRKVLQKFVLINFSEGLFQILTIVDSKPFHPKYKLFFLGGPCPPYPLEENAYA